MSLRDIKIGLRLALAFGLLALLVVLLGGSSLHNINRMSAAGHQITENWMPSLAAIADVNLSLMRFRIFTLRAALDDTPEELAQTSARLDSIRQDLDKAGKRYESLISEAGERQVYGKLLEVKQAYIAGSAEVVSAMQIGDTATARSLIETRLNVLADQMTQLLLNLNQINSEGAVNATAQSDAAHDSSRTAILTSIAIALVLTLVLALVVTRSITLPIANAVKAAETVAEGVLTQRIDTTGKDEPAQLLTALARMQANLRGAISHISDSAAQLAAATEELHAVAEDASRNLQNQNSEIQQAASAITEMSAAVDEVARNASGTAEESNQSARLAHEGRDKVQETISSIESMTSEFTKTSHQIEGLAEESKDIGKVLDVIRGIAEQTNLLALNAAIEAARAGEAGRGFAVVADEVRALAHRTQVSTREIEQMVSKVQSGTQATVDSMRGSVDYARQTLGIAEQAGSALEEIYRQVGKISERNLLIASASEEQAAVAREVDRNIVNISDFSTQSAAGANQTSASAQELARLAVDLNGLVARFVI
ncbi:methyl-accepting chemotaxis protein [Cellvibrio sp. NN19]|uniref:methyl-accepting chemotaxis protein n=1 Tax=Cellvibrio chitinivorans TaxID=3102792 RepID=UPI002B405EDE|nr:methyl-accepting chemotaxis protein [Cellvibrio sp. NN19]